MEYVLAVIDQGTFTAAAQSIPVSQPALSQGIRSLERELGVDLFHRVGRNVVPTEAGRAFVPPARQALADRERILEAVASISGLEGGTLDLVTLPTLAVSPLVDLVGRFRHAHPGVALRVREHEGSSGDVLRLVRDGTCELGLVELPAGGTPDGLEARSLGAQEYLMVCPPGTRLPRRPVKVEHLAHLPLAATPEGTSSRRLLDDAFTAAGFEPPAIAVESWHRELLEPLVLSGAASALLPAPMAEHARQEGAIVASLEPPLRRSIGLVHRHGVLSPAAEAFLALT